MLPRPKDAADRMNETRTSPVWNEESLRDPHDASDKSRRVRVMFDAIAPTYERVNRWFSFGRDAAWRREAVRLAKVGAADAVLDVACGTGDFSRAFAAGGAGQVVGCDFALGMLKLAAQRPVSRATWCAGDALTLPFADATFDVASCAFGVRNFQNLDAGLREFHRVLRGGGRAVILEFTRPARRVIRGAYEWYSGKVMPLLATWMSRDRIGAYRYLPRSVVSFPGATEMSDRLRAAGFSRVLASPRTFGVVTIYVAWKDA